MRTRLLLLIVGTLIAGCAAENRSNSLAEFSPPLLNESVDVKALEGLWQMSLSTLEPSTENEAGKPCLKIKEDPVTLKVSDGTILTWHFGGKATSVRIDNNGIFTFNKSSGYAHFYPETRKRMPRPINVTIRARISEEGTGEGAIVYLDENNEYAVCGSSLGFQKLD